MSFLLGQEQADAGLTGLGSEFEFGTDAAGAFVHDVQADMVARQALKMLGIEAAAVVGNRHHEIAAIVDFDVYLVGLGVLADIGQALLQDKDALQLLVAGKRRALVANPVDMGGDAGLAVEALDQLVGGFGKVAAGDFGAEV